MKTALLILEIFSGVLLVGAILLHSPKNEGMGAIGGQARSFKPVSNDLEAGIKKITFLLAMLFFGSALLLGLLF